MKYIFERDTEMVEFVMLVGLPGSGKSTYAKNNYPDYHIFSSDAIRGELFGDEGIQGDNVKVFRILHDRIISSLSKGVSCVYDATNLSYKNRVDFLNRVTSVEKKCHITIKKTCMVIVRSIDGCKKMNAKRDRVVPEFVIDRMVRNFWCPGFFEGWDVISFTTMDSSPALPDFDMNQDNPHHTLSLLKHMEKTQQFILKNYGYDKCLSVAAVFHDIGKYYTKSFLDSKGIRTPVAHYYNHENYGAYIMLHWFLDVYSENNDSTSVAEIIHIILLINWHMRPYVWEKSKNAEDKDYRIIGDVLFNDLIVLNKADRVAH
jgi:predicted kinase